MQASIVHACVSDQTRDVFGQSTHIPRSIDRSKRRIQGPRLPASSLPSSSNPRIPIKSLARIDRLERDLWIPPWQGRTGFPELFDRVVRHCVPDAAVWVDKLGVTYHADNRKHGQTSAGSECMNRQTDCTVSLLYFFACSTDRETERQTELWFHLFLSFSI